MWEKEPRVQLLPLILMLRENLFYLLWCAVFPGSLLTLSPLSPQTHLPFEHILVECGSWMWCFLTCFFQRLKPNRNQRVELSMLFNRLMERHLQCLPAECSCVSMDLNISVTIPALLDIQVVPSSFPVFKTNTACPDE